MFPINGAAGGIVRFGSLTLEILPGAFAGNRNVLIWQANPIATADQATQWVVYNTWGIYADGAFGAPLLALATFSHPQPHSTWPGKFFSHEIIFPMPDNGAELTVASIPGLARGTTDYLPTRHNDLAGPNPAGVPPRSNTSFLTLMY